MLSFSDLSDKIGGYNDISHYSWKCYGDLTISFSHYRKDTETGIDVKYNSRKNLVVEIDIYGKMGTPNLRWIHPEYFHKYVQECLDRSINFSNFLEEEYYTEVDYDTIIKEIESRN